MFKKYYLASCLISGVRTNVFMDKHPVQFLAETETKVVILNWWRISQRQYNLLKEKKGKK